MFKFLGPVKEFPAYQARNGNICYGIFLNEQDAIKIVKKNGGIYEPITITSDDLLVNDNSLGIETDATMKVSKDLTIT